MTLYDLAYALAICVAAPVWLVMPRLRPKVLEALRERTGKVPAAEPGRSTVLIHAVSMGEINATTALVRELSAALPDLRFVISTTSHTGEARARQLYENNSRVTRIRYPFDFSQSVARMLDAQKPKVAVLMELEVWPNFMRECETRGIPVLLINGRLSAHSFRRYRLAGPFIRPTFRRLTTACVQEDVYADRFERVGVPADRIRVTGTMKFDTAQVGDHIDGANAIAASVGIRIGEEKVWVCGSTGPGEEQIVLDAYADLLNQFGNLRLVLVPRHPERFDEVADLIRARGMGLVRRSKSPGFGAPATSAAVVLGDTMGELRQFYSLGDVVFVGRTLVDLGPKQHGSDMIEPAALAKPVIVGRFTGNFMEVMNRFRQAKAMREVNDAVQLRGIVGEMLASPATASAMGKKAQEVVRENQGATARHVELILEELV